MSRTYMIIIAVVIVLLIAAAAYLVWKYYYQSYCFPITGVVYTTSAAGTPIAQLTTSLDAMPSHLSSKNLSDGYPVTITMNNTTFSETTLTNLSTVAGVSGFQVTATNLKGAPMTSSTAKARVTFTTPSS